MARKMVDLELMRRDVERDAPMSRRLRRGEVVFLGGFPLLGVSCLAKGFPFAVPRCDGVSNLALN